MTRIPRKLKKKIPVGLYCYERRFRRLEDVLNEISIAELEEINQSQEI